MHGADYREWNSTSMDSNSTKLVDYPCATWPILDCKAQCGVSEFAEMPQILLLVVLLSGAAAFAKDENDSKSAKGEDFM